MYADKKVRQLKINSHKFIRKNSSAQKVLIESFYLMFAKEFLSNYPVCIISTRTVWIKPLF